MDEQHLQSKTNLLQKLQIFDPALQRGSNVANSETPGQHHFDNYFQYILSLVGFAVGFGSFWRFPYLVYKNGGGAFLIPYFLAMIFLGVPLLYLQTIVGQIHQCSQPLILAKVNKGFKMLGITCLFVCYHLTGYYNIIMTYCYRFIFSSFQNPLPFADQTPFENQYFKTQILHASSSISEFGSIQPFLFFLYMVSFLICYIVVKDGVKTSGKVVIYTALSPFILLIVLAIKGIFLDGAFDGLSYLLIPDFSKLFAIQIWIDAVGQVFYQLSVGIAGLINFSSLKPKKQRHLRGLVIIPLSIVTCGMLCALNVFIYLGHFCKEQNIDIRNLTLSGPQLSFNIFPKALAILPWPNLWFFLFAVTLVLLGLDSQFAFMQTCLIYLKDEAYVQNKDGRLRIFNFSISLRSSKIIFMCFLMIFAPFMCSSAGIYYLEFFDRFSATIPISVGAVLNYIFFVKIIPFQELQAESQKYTKQSSPKWIKYLLQGKIVIAILLINLILGFVNQFFYFFKYPFKFYIFGWVITLYPYVMAYWYYRKYHQDKNHTSFLEFKKQRNSEL